jgi:hypothetical protein
VGGVDAPRGCLVKIWERVPIETIM